MDKIIMPQESQPLASCPTEFGAPRLCVFSRLDLICVDAAADIDHELEDLEQMSPLVFETEEAARQFYAQHLTTHAAPIYLASLANRQGPAFTGLRFSQYHPAPAGTRVGVAMDFALDNPIRCTLKEDWRFGTVEKLVAQTISHKTVRRYPAHPARELVEALHDLEVALYNFHGGLSRDACEDVWSSFELHRHLTVRALEMERYHGDYPESIGNALDYVRRHVADYVDDVLSADAAFDQLKPAYVSLANTVQWLKANNHATVQELEELFNLDRKTLRRLELGKPVRQSTVDKAPACGYTLAQLTQRLLENRKRKRSLT